MRTGAARDHEGFFHETAFYGSDADFLSIVVPFLEGGLSAGEPTLVACGPANTELLRGALGRRDAVTFLPGGDQYARPTDAIARYREIYREHTAAGATQIRVIGDVPHPGVGAPWDWWARYEAAANKAYDDFPLWGLCPYDTRTTPGDVLADVMRTHPHIATTTGAHLANPDFSPGFPLTAPRADVLEQGPPLIELVDASPSVVRRAVHAVAGTIGLSENTAQDVVYAASELVTNGMSHGRPPVRFRLWADESRVVVTVTDLGTGPSDPLIGLMPTTATRSAGLGLWVLHRTSDHVSMERDEDGFTVRVVVGGPPR